MKGKHKKASALATLLCCIVAVPGARLVHIDPHAIVPNPRQPRTHFDPDVVDAFDSVKEEMRRIVREIAN